MKVIAKLLAATAAIGMATSAFAADMTMKFGHVGAPGSLFEAIGRQLCRLRERRDGRQGRGADLWIVAAGQGQGTAAKAQAGSGRFLAAVLGDVVG